MRRLFQIIALLGLVFVANATAMPTLCRADHANLTRPEAAALLADIGAVPADAFVAVGSCEDWDDETKPACPPGEFVASAPRLAVRAPSARSRPHRLARLPDRRTATLVGVVVILI